MTRVALALALLLPTAAVADDDVEERIAALEAEVAYLQEKLVELGRIVDMFATGTRIVLAENAALLDEHTARIEAIEKQTETGLSRREVRQMLRQQCIQRQTIQHGLGGPVPDFSQC